MATTDIDGHACLSTTDIGGRLLVGENSIRATFDGEQKPGDEEAANSACVVDGRSTLSSSNDCQKFSVAQDCEVGNDGYDIIPSIDSADIFFVETVDIDRDNYTDIIYTGETALGLFVAFGTPDGDLETPINVLSISAAAIETDYLDSDTLLDIVAVTSTTVYLLFNNGDRTFTIDSLNPSSALTGATFTGTSDGDLQAGGSIPSVATEYFDEDDFLDIILAPNFVLLGTSSGNVFMIRNLPFTFDVVDACDFDNDGWLDLFVANDQSLDSLLRNKGDGTFEDVGIKTGLFDPRGAMGVAVTDVHADGDQDLFVTHWVNEDPAFYVNNTGGKIWGFDDTTTRLGLRKPDTALVGWGTGFVDFDNDGDRDLFVIYGSTIEDELTLDVLKNPKMLPQKSQVYEWREDRWFALGKAAGPYFDEHHVGRGGAVSDFDGDGRPDLAINNHSGAPALLRNVSKAGHWVNVVLVGRHCNRDGANARVTLHREGAAPQMRELFLGGSYLSGHSKVIHFGVGELDRAVRIEVRWPCGKTQTLQNVALNRTHVVTEPTP
ncbi:MAG: CRTAC1 family protein [Planctomycetes bacterium]|nr:CRTAC1 family protein [Planctomycetota bacterium]